MLIICQIITGTKCDRDKIIFSAEKRSQQDRVGYKKGTQWDLKMSKKGVNPGEVPYHLQVWWYPPPSPVGTLLINLYNLQYVVKHELPPTFSVKIIPLFVKFNLARRFSSHFIWFPFHNILTKEHKGSAMGHGRFAGCVGFEHH